MSRDCLVEPLREAALQRRARYAERVERLSAAEDGLLPVDDFYYAAVGLRRVMIDAERETLVEWRNAGRLPDISLRVLQRELDHEEGLLPTGKPEQGPDRTSHPLDSTIEKAPPDDPVGPSRVR